MGIPAVNTCQGIPLQNLWLLMLYASDFRYQAQSYVGSENMDEHLADLVADVLCNQVSQRLRRQLSHGYRQTQAHLTRVRGRINSLETTRKMLLLQGKVACEFEELSSDTLRNQYVAYALNKSLKVVRNPVLKSKAKKLLADYVGQGVSVGHFCAYRPQNERFSRHELEDKKVVATAELMLNLALINESVGHQLLPSPDKQEHWVRRLFEKAVHGFYSLNLETEWTVKGGKKLAWQIEDMTSNIANLLPGMKLDILLENETQNRRLIIDTKFTSITQSAQFGGESYKSNYIYQLYSYLRSQEEQSDLLSLKSEGMLLHPSMGVTHRESVLIQGHKLKFCTVDLSQSSGSIKRELNSIIADL
ncbi:5-methylcytosine restriction system specificity protein McrC [Flavobacterium sp. W21_SRS_FM6]|uniref:5-methylcytosine restriction system specificity protein McrC n=1 Tax=Flavobacterium sp. W21_SRS_FM6 TaxID=3240268 RepID=UPI003F8EBAAF